MLIKSTIASVLVALLAISTVDAHVGLKVPCPRRGPFAGCPALPKGVTPDYDINTPVGIYGKKNFPICKNTTVQSKRVVYKAGQVVKTSYNVGASHGGGHCQWSLSYDKGKTWIVIGTQIRTCLQNVAGGANYSINVTIPKNAPAGDAIFQWQWNNAIGNRELYSNCADVHIDGVKNGSMKGVSPLMANYGTDSLLIPEFPNKTDDDKHAAFAKRKAVTVTGPKM